MTSTEGYKDENGQVHSQTEWPNIVLWRGLAELAEKYLKKGSTVHIEGKNRTRFYEDKQGVKRYVTEVVGEEIIMQIARQLSLFLAITLWAMMVGAIVYSHIVYFPPYLSHLPESNKLITGDYGIHDENFWMLVPQFALLATILTLILNWKLKIRRKFILIAFSIYVLSIVAITIYFVPGLMAFADSNNQPTVSPSEWFQRGQRWQHLSCIRGSFITIGFLMLLVALTKDKTEIINRN
ncbi:MAG: single-stranded DNA-binding protein [Saprospiraceae bacterium]